MFALILGVSDGALIGVTLCRRLENDILFNGESLFASRFASMPCMCAGFGRFE